MTITHQFTQHFRSRHHRNQRGSGGLHFYAGYNGSMSWEYNLGACDDAGLADLCACVGTNNALAYQRESGQACRGTGENVYPSASARFA